MSERRVDYATFERAVTPVQTNGVVTGNKINATASRRAVFTFVFEKATTASLVAGCGVYNAATSGAAFTVIAGGSFGAKTSGVLTDWVGVIDVKVDPAKPWLIVSGMSFVSTTIIAAATVELYECEEHPPATVLQDTTATSED